MKRLAAVIAAALVVVVALAAGALARERPAEMERLAAASGALALTNSAAGAAIITAHGLMPGQATSGTLTLGNTGEAAGLLVLARTSIHDQPGPYGGRLSDVAHAPDRGRERRAGKPREVFYGELGGLERVALDALAGGAQRTYRFTVEFPDTGPGGADNAYMGSSVRFDYQWRAEALPLPPAATPTPGPGTKPPPGGTGRPAAPAGPGAEGETPGGPSRAPFIYLKIPHQRVMHTDAVRLYARCSARCKVRFSGRAQTAPRAKRAKRRPLLRRGLFRGERTVPPGRRQAAQAAQAQAHPPRPRRAALGARHEGARRRRHPRAGQGQARHPHGQAPHRPAHHADPQRQAHLGPLTGTSPSWATTR